MAMVSIDGVLGEQETTIAFNNKEFECTLLDDVDDDMALDVALHFEQEGLKPS